MSKKHYALVGTGSRAGMYVEAITTTYREAAELVALCDLSQVRMDWYNREIETATGNRVPTYLASDFDRNTISPAADVLQTRSLYVRHG